MRASAAYHENAEVIATLDRFVEIMPIIEGINLGRVRKETVLKIYRLALTLGYDTHTAIEIETRVPDHKLREFEGRRAGLHAVTRDRRMSLKTRSKLAELSSCAYAQGFQLALSQLRS